MSDRLLGPPQEDVRSIMELRRDIRRSLAALQVELQELKSELHRVPGITQLWAMTVSTWIAGAVTVMLVVHFVQQ